MEAEKQTRELTDQQRSFVLHFTTTPGVAGNAAAAARSAGYSEKYAADIARQLIEKPHVRMAIDAALREAIGTHLTVAAVGVIQKIIGDETANLRLRGDMALKVIEYSGLVDRTKAAKARETGQVDKCLTELTRDELHQVVSLGAQVLKLADELGRQSLRPN